MTTPPAEHGPPDDEQRLLGFLRGRDVACPLCGYNLRNLTRPVCPECRQPLVLSVGLRDVRLGWLIMTLAPCIFSGIAFCFAMVPFVGMTIEQGTLPPPWFIAMVAFGGASGLASVALYRLRSAFLRLRPEQQRWVAAGTWALHVLVFLAVVGVNVI